MYLSQIYKYSNCEKKLIELKNLVDGFFFSTYTECKRTSIKYSRDVFRDRANIKKVHANMSLETSFWDKENFIVKYYSGIYLENEATDVISKYSAE